MTAQILRRHSRAGGIAKTGVEANISFADSPEGELPDAARHPVLNSSVHPELVEGFIRITVEWFDKLTMNCFTGFPPARE